MIARLRVEHQQWDEGMKKARKGVDDLQKSTGGMDAVLGKAVKSVGAMAAATLTLETAMAAARKAISSNHDTAKAWQGIMAAGTRVVDSFFESLNRGDFTSFTSGLDQIIERARKASEALMETKDVELFGGYSMSSLKQDTQRQKYNIQAGIDVEASKEKIRQNEAEMLRLTEETAKAYMKGAEELLKSLTDSPEGLQRLVDDFKAGGLNTREQARARAQEIEAKYKKTERVPFGSHGRMSRKQAIRSGYDGVTLLGEPYRLDWGDNTREKQMFEAYTKLANMPQDKLEEVLGLMNKSNATWESFWNAKRENLESLNRQIQTPGGGGSKEYTAQKFDLTEIEAPTLGKTTSMAELERQLAEWQQRLKEATTSAGAQAAEAMIAKLQANIEAQPLALKLDLPEEEVAGIQAQMRALSESINQDVMALKPLDTTALVDKNVKPLKETAVDVQAITQHVGEASSAFGQLGSAMQQLEDPSAKIAGMVMEAVASVASSFAAALASEKNVWTWIAAAISGTATMISTISAIKSVTSGSYAEGGMVTGGAFTGDAVPIMANAGEVVLSAAQQQSLAGQLQPRDMGDERQPYMTGEMMWLGMSNYLRRSGKGEVVTSRR